jgi:AcrR family transcriptional regulator
MGIGALLLDVLTKWVRNVSMSIDIPHGPCHTVGMSLDDDSLSARQDAILDAAFHAFAAYGYRKATMEDVARAAGLSRTALYQHWRNKEDLFRRLAERYFAAAEAALRAELARPGRPPAETLIAAFAAKDGKFMEAVLATPHGGELLEAGYAVSGDIAEAGEGAMARAFADWFAQHRLAPGLGTPAEVTATMKAALKGLKSSSRSLAEYRAGQERLARLMALAILSEGGEG